jgi:hypothetical protein
LSFVLGMDSKQYVQGVSLATAQTSKFTDAIDAARKETTRLKEAMSTPPPTPPNPAPEKHAQSVRHLRHELQLLGEGAGALGADLGQIGSLSSLIFNPWLLSAAGAMAALQIFQERWAQMRRSMVNVIEQTQQSLIGRLEAWNTATNEAAAATARFHSTLEHSADGMDQESMAMDRRIEMFQRMTEAQREVFEAQRRSNSARIEADQAAGESAPPKRSAGSKPLKRRNYWPRARTK